MRRLAAVAVAAVLTLTACTSGSGGKDEKDGEGPSLPLPAKAPTARGPAVGPALEPKVLLSSSDDLESMAGDLDSAQVDRRSGAFVSGRTVVGYSVDDISGYDLRSGEQKWTADLDVGTGTVCFVSKPDRAVKTFTVVHGDGLCSKLATIRVSDGKVVKTSTRLEDFVEFEGEGAGGSVDHLFSVGGRDHLVDMRGVVWRMVKGEPKPLARLAARSYFQLSTTPDRKTLIGTRLSDRGRCRVDGYALPSFERLWTQDTKTLFPEVTEDCVIVAAQGSPAWLTQETGDREYMAQLEPRTGKVLGRADAPKSGGRPAEKGEFELASAANQLDRALGLPGGDTIFAQVNGLTRFSLETGKVAWDLDLSQLQLDSDEEFPLTTVLPQGITADGYVVASVSNDTDVEVIAADVKTGKLAARWAVPQEYRNGFQVEPGMTLSGEGVVLTRNFEAWQRTFADYLDRKEPKGEKYDIGVFTFPQPDDSATTTVPTKGPTDTDAKALGGLKTPKDAKQGRGAGTFSTGSTVVAYSGGTVTGRDPRSGKQRWSMELEGGDAARVCVAPEPDTTVKTFVIAVRTSAKGTCDTLVRVKVSDGSVMDRLQLPRAAKTVSRIVVHEGAVHVVTGDRAVSRFADGALQREATLAHSPWQLERSPEDPSLAIAISPVKDQRDWAIDAYRLPSFDPVWSTRASTVLKKVERKNPVSLWRGNGLWVSTTYGDTAKTGAVVKDSLVALDPGTGKVVGRTGAVKRTYGDGDLKRFSLLGAITSAYVSVGLDNGDVVVPQDGGIMRYSLTDDTVRWATDLESIEAAMERDRKGSFVTESLDLVDGGKTVLVTLSNQVSVELMTMSASTGKITGRWNVPKAARNGLQAGPSVTAYAGGVALTHNEYSWDYAFNQTDREVPPEQRYDVGLFSLPKPKKK